MRHRCFSEGKFRVIRVVMLAIATVIVIAVAWHNRAPLATLLSSRDSDDSQESSLWEQPLGSEHPYEASALLGGEWFLQNQDVNFLHYEYDSLNHVHPDTSHQLREMGALWSIAYLASYFDDERFAKLAERGIDYFNEKVAESPDGDFLYVNGSDGESKLGYSAFLILALIEMDSDEHAEMIEGLADGILSQQQPDGSLQTFFFSDKNSSVDYYPGEALFSLMSLYEHDPDARYLTAVEKAFPYYASYWRENRNTAFVPWQTRAYVMLYEQTGDPEVRDFVFEMNDYMTARYAVEGDCSKYSMPGETVIAVYTEGVIQAYRLAVMADDTDRTECYGNYVREALATTMALQVTVDDSTDLSTVGGFSGIGDEGVQRVDRNQHAVVALLDAVRAGL